MALKRMDNIGIVVEDLGRAIDFFLELGLSLEMRAMIEGEWAGRVTGLRDQQVECGHPTDIAASNSPVSSGPRSPPITGRHP